VTAQPGAAADQRAAAPATGVGGNKTGCPIADELARSREVHRAAGARQPARP
jgi:hypothetical protein